MEVNVLSVKETAELLKTSTQQVRKMIHEGILPAFKVGREYRISYQFLSEFFNSSGDY